MKGTTSSARSWARVALPGFGAPIERGEGCHVDAAGSDREHEVSHQVWLLERCEHGDDAPHRLGEYVDWSIYFPCDPCDEVRGALDVGLRRRAKDSE